MCNGGQFLRNLHVPSQIIFPLPWNPPFNGSGEKPGGKNVVEKIRFTEYWLLRILNVKLQMFADPTEVGGDESGDHFN